MNKFENALQQIIEVCGTVSFSSHNQMKDAIQASLEIAEAVMNPERSVATEADSSNSPDPQNAQKDPVIDWDRLEKEFHRTQCWEKPNDYFGTTYQFLATPKSLLNWLKSNLSNYIK